MGLRSYTPILVLISGVACSSDPAQIPAKDSAMADRGIPDLLRKDLQARDGPGADQALPDRALPDQALLDQALPDQALPDKGLPDKALPDMALHDLPPPDVWTCGNNVIEGTEECEGVAPLGTTCVTLGFKRGTLKCDKTKCRLDKSGCTNKVWPLGIHGALRVGKKHGKTNVLLYPGETWDLSELIIESDGVVEIAPGPGWVIIGVNGNVRIDGKLVGKKSTGIGTITANLPDAAGTKGLGPQISHTVVQAAGGKGGWTNGGKGAFGNGGGGGRFNHAPTKATLSAAGGGAMAECWSGKYVLGGKGATTHGAPGGSGAVCTAYGGWNGGSCGGGGFRGYHGGLIHFQVRGAFDGKGTIDLEGSPGGKGGNGGAGKWAGGHGGGGGGGGAGGRLAVKLTGTMVMFPTQIKLSAGAGGAAGAGGSGGTSGKPGAAGAKGAAGSFSKITWVE